jgi:hypothetical protein
MWRVSVQSIVVGCVLVLAPVAGGQASAALQSSEGLSSDDWAGIQEAYLKASNAEGRGQYGDVFGFSVAVSGDTVAVGAFGESSSATGVNGDQSDNGTGNAGAVYIFVKSAGSWTQQAYLKASNSGSQDRFGLSLGLSEHTLVVGAPNEASSATGVNGDESLNVIAFAGAAYVFVRNGTTWSQQAYLKASNTGNDSFGRAVAVSGDTVVVGAYHEDSDASGVNGDESNNDFIQSGAAYVFVRNGTNWSQQAYLKASDSDWGDEFGWSVAASGETIVVGAYREDGGATGINGDDTDNSAAGAGAAYVFVRNGTTWSQQAYLKASNSQVLDQFGHSVGISDDTIAVGAWREDSNATGVDGDQANNSVSVAGAAYVFVRNGTSWSQQAYLKASNPEVLDQFGYSIAVSGNTIVVGANGEDSNATGVDGDDSDNSAPEAGAAFVFTRSGTTWSPRAYLKASNTGAGDAFGTSVSVSGDTLAVGAYLEDSNSTGVNGDQSDNSAPDAGASYLFDVVSSGWFDMGCALAGVSGDPLLVGTGDLSGGSSNTVRLTNAAPAATAGLFLALSSTPVPFKGGTLKPFPFFDPVILTTDPMGAIFIPFSMTPGLPAGTELWVQWAIQDAAAISAVSLSNAIVGITP